MKETYFAKSEKEHYTFRAASLEDARHWVINHLDTSQTWNIGPIHDPMPKEENYTYGAPDASGEIYDNVSPLYEIALKEWEKRNN